MDLRHSWYPLGRSADLARGAVRAVELAGTRLALFRGADGAAGALLARCRHFGADLVHGAVVAAGLRCPLHHRCYGVDGGATGAVGAAQPALPVVERWGLVFAWCGPLPAAPLPEPDGIAAGLATRPSLTIADAPLGLIAANAFDTAHLAPVHGRNSVGAAVVTELGPRRIRIAITAQVAGRTLRDRALRASGLAAVRIETDCWGGNLLFFHHRAVGTCTLLALRPETAERTAVHAVSMRARPAGALAPWDGRLRLAVQHRAIMAFARQDLRALRGARSGPVEPDPVSDACVARFLAHEQALPSGGWDAWGRS